MQRLIIVWATCLLLAPCASAITITFDYNVVHVNGVTPGGRVVLFGVAQTPKSGSAITKVLQVATDDARAGRVMFQLNRVVPDASIWAAVDVATGTSFVATPFGYTAPTMDAPSTGNGGNLKVTGYWLDVLLVRPQVGAWQLTPSDGAASDADGTADGRIAVSPARMHSVGPADPPAPSGFAPGDTVIVIDPIWMRYSTSHVVQQ